MRTWNAGSVVLLLGSRLLLCCSLLLSPLLCLSFLCHASHQAHTKSPIPCIAVPMGYSSAPSSGNRVKRSATGGANQIAADAGVATEYQPWRHKDTHERVVAENSPSSREAQSPWNLLGNLTRRVAQPCYPFRMGPCILTVVPEGRWRAELVRYGCSGGGMPPGELQSIPIGLLADSPNLLPPPPQ